MSRPLIKDYMHTHPWTVEYYEHLGTAEKMMRDHNVRHLPVTDGRKLYGIISDRDLKLAARVYKDYASVRIREICLSSPYVVADSESLETVAATMARRRIGSALVTKNGDLAGIFTNTDACRLLAEILKTGGI